MPKFFEMNHMTTTRDQLLFLYYNKNDKVRITDLHQGIVWGWLIGPFITALVRVHGDEGRQRGRAIIAGFAEHLRETGLGSISEIFDAEPPFAPRGCAAQAWSVAELLRAGVEDVLEQGPQ